MESSRTNEKPTKVFHVQDIDEHYDDEFRFQRDVNCTDFDEFNDGWDPRDSWGY